MSTAQKDTSINERIIKYEPMVHQLIRKFNIIYNINDFVQIGRMAIYEALNKFDATYSVNESQYVYTMIRQRLIDEIRKAAKHQTTIIDPIDIDIPIEIDFYNGWLHDAKKVLNDNEWSWLILTLDGYSIAEIAHIESKSISTVKNWRQCARRKLKPYFFITTNDF